MPTDREDQPAPAPVRRSYRFLLTPKWIGFHLLVIVLVVTMVNLAFWQLRRLHDRREFNSNVRANAAQPVVPLDSVDLTVPDQRSIEWRRVEVTGTYLTGHELLVVNRSQNGDTGRNVVDALQLGDGSLLLVNRGFVPITQPAPPPPSGEVMVTGTLRRSERRGAGQPADTDEPGLTEIHRIDLGVLRGQFDAPLAPLYLERLDSRPADSPVLEQIAAPQLDEGPHLSYMIQWFIFSACTVAGWFLAVRRSAAARAGIAPRRSRYVPIADDGSAS